MKRFLFDDHCLVFEKADSGLKARAITSLALLLVLLSWSKLVVAATEDTDKKKLVEVEIQGDLREAYKTRRSRWGLDLGANYHKVFPSDEAYAESFNKNDLSFTEVFIGPKVNVGPISLSITGVYGQGGSTGKVLDTTTIDTMITMTKYGGMATVFLDGLFSEPYIVPYGSFQYFNLSYDVKLGEEKRHGDLGYISAVYAGLLIQLNWVEPEVAYQSRKDYGIENAYIDVFANQYYSGPNSSDFDTASTWNWGAGLRMEF